MITIPYEHVDSRNRKTSTYDKGPFLESYLSMDSVLHKNETFGFVHQNDPYYFGR